MDKAIKILSWNIRSIRLRENDLHMYVMQNNVDVVCLQEPFPLSTKQIKVPRLPGYVDYYHKFGNGLMCYVKETLTHRLIRKPKHSKAQFQLFELIIGETH